jgi:hypothetical protein
MSTRYDLDIRLGYKYKTRYKGLHKPREWVRGMAVDVKMEVTNNSKMAFPGAKVNVTINEYGGAIGSRVLSWEPAEEILIPELDTGKSATVPLINFYPLVEGLCEVRLELQAPDKSEVWVTGWRQSKPQQNTISGHFTVVGWQELEIIKLLSKLQKGE